WFAAASSAADRENTVVTKAYPVDGGRPVPLCVGYCSLSWDSQGKFAFLDFSELFEGSYVLPVQHDSGLPKLPPAGVARKEDLGNVKSATVIPSFVDTALSPSVYAYTRRETRRNLYRIQLQ
ncbi:MAG: hypothetical protein WBZ32_13440, partial [Candidatus Acidiferrales bacterium]